MAAANRKASARVNDRAAARPNARLTDALAEASWAEADEALAEALIELAALQRASAKKGAGADALVLLAQALSRAARRRGLTLFGGVGAVLEFEPTSHLLEGAPSAERVKIVREGVMSGNTVLVRALVAPALKSAKKARR